VEQISSEPLWFEVRLGAAVEEELLFELGVETVQADRTWTTFFATGGPKSRSP